MFVPTTPEGRLKQKLQQMDARLQFKSKCKYIEVAGDSILSILFSGDPWKTLCGREDCAICPTEPGKCSSRSVVYRFDCKLCQETETKTAYIG